MGNCAAASRSRSRSRHAAAVLCNDGVARVAPHAQPPEQGEKGLGDDDQVMRSEKGVEVKIRITRRQLRELLEKAGGGGALEEKVAVEKMLAEMVNAGQVVRRRPDNGEARWSSWRPALRTIPEDVDDP